jgi:hypothetical protein
MGNQNISGWIVGSIIVLLITAGIWWFLQKAPVATDTGTVSTDITGTPVPY